MSKSMLFPGKQHNFRVAKNASWTDAFNRIATRNQWSVNHTMNVLVHSALNMHESTNDSVMVEITPKELEILLRLRQAPLQSILVTEETSPLTPSESPVAQKQSEPEPVKVPSVKEEAPQSGKKLSALERARLQQKSSSMQ